MFLRVLERWIAKLRETSESLRTPLQTKIIRTAATVPVWQKRSACAAEAMPAWPKHTACAAEMGPVWQKHEACAREAEPVC